MKAICCTIITALMLSSFPAQALDLGDGSDVVLRELGPPTGHLRTGDREVYLYDRGEVEIRADRVSRIELLSQAEAAARRQASEAALENNRRWADLQQVARHEQGLLERARLLEDPSFAFRPASEQVSAWKGIRSRYPSVDVKAEYAAALRQLELELAEQRIADERARQLRDLEQRVAAAEERAQAAERAAMRQPVYLNSFYGSSYYPVAYPVTVVSRSACYPAPRPAFCARPASGLTITYGSSSRLVRGNYSLVRN